MNKTPRSLQREREYALYRYRNALEHGDFDTLSIILKQAERDPRLNQMIEEMDAILESASERETGSVDWRSVSPTPFPNGQPTKPKITQEQPKMTTQPAYWEPAHQAGNRVNRMAVAMLALVAALVIGIVFLFLIPSGKDIRTLVIQQPTPTVAEIAQLYVDEVWGKGNKNILKTLIATDIVDHDPLLINRSRVVSANDQNNNAVFNYNVEILRRAFPDITVTTEAIIESTDTVVVRWTFTGTHKARLLDYAASNKSITITNTDILRIANGTIVERWGENKLEAVKNALGIVNITEPAAIALTTYARFAEILGAGKFENLGEVFAEDAVFNKAVTGLKAIQTTVEGRYKELNGISNIRIISAYVLDNHMVAQVEFDTDNSQTHNQEVIDINLKDGKFVSYDAS